jgi:hypothetical protein
LFGAYCGCANFELNPTKRNRHLAAMRGQTWASHPLGQATRGEPSVITRHGKPELVILGFGSGSGC